MIEATKQNQLLKTIIDSFATTSAKAYIENFCGTLGEIKAMNVTMPRTHLQK